MTMARTYLAALVAGVAYTHHVAAETCDRVVARLLDSTEENA